MESSGTPPWERRAPWILAAILGLGLALRLYRLSEQSVWMDEFNVMAGLSEGTWKGYLTTISFYAPDNLPLAWLIRYACTSVIDPLWLLGVRLEQVAFGMACIPLVYFLGKNVYGRGAGLLAALCLALSPIHIWTAQDLRPNVEIEFFAALSILSFAMGLRSGGSKWWFLNIVANLCLLWTHLFLVFLVAAECCVMAPHIRSHFKRTVLWGAAQCATCLSPLLWLGIHFSSASDVDEDFWRSLPRFRDLVVDLVGDDAVRASDPFAFQGQTWPFLPPQIQQAVDAWHGLFDIAIGLFFAVSALWAVVCLYRAWRRSIAHGNLGDSPEFFLLILSFVPPLMLFLASWLFRPMMMPRYTSYCSLALYVIAGGFIVSFRQAHVRGLLSLLLVMLYGYQLSLALPANTRTDWRSAIAWIGGHASPGEIILAKGTVLTRPMYLYNARIFASKGKGIDPIVVPAYTLRSVAGQSARALSTPDPPNAVWAVMERFAYSMPPLADFEACLAARGLAWTRTDFPGMNGIQVYRITRADRAPVEASPACGLEGAFADYPGMLADMGFSKADGPEYDKALESLRDAVDSEWPRSKLYYAFLGLVLCDGHQSALAVRAAQCSVKRDPKYAFGHFALAVAQYESGAQEAGDAAFSRALACDTNGLIVRYAPLLQALYPPKGEPPSGGPSLSSRLADLESRGFYLPFAFYLRSGTLPAAATAAG